MFRLCAALFLTGALPAATAWGQDFQRSITLPSGGLIRVGNVSGDVRVEGYSGNSVIVEGFKEGRDRDLVKIEDLSSGDRVDVRVRYPENCSCDASVNFQVRVPANISYNFDRIYSVSGNVDITGITGRLRAESVSGDVDVAGVTGLVSASSVSGDVNAAIVEVEGAGDMKFSSVSGNVTVRAPSSLDADIEMSSVSGSLKTDFAIEVHEPRYGPGRSARGRLGSGAHSLRISTVSGRVSLSRNE
jgi:hypothetical protein